MEEAAGLVANYVAGLGRYLAFDRALARSACREVEDHLREAVASSDLTDSAVAERCAVARFGDPRLLAAEWAQVAAARGIRRTGAAGVVVIATAFVMMKARMAWYVATGSLGHDGVSATSHAVALIDRYAFWTATLIGIGTWIYIVSCGRAAGAAAVCHLRQQRFLQLSGAAAGALLVSVAADGILTAVRALGADPVALVVPLVSMAAEVVGAGILVACIGRMRLLARAAAALQGD